MREKPVLWRLQQDVHAQRQRFVSADALFRAFAEESQGTHDSAVTLHETVEFLVGSHEEIEVFQGFSTRNRENQGKNKEIIRKSQGNYKEIIELFAHFSQSSSTWNSGRISRFSKEIHSRVFMRVNSALSKNVGSAGKILEKSMEFH